MEEPTPQELQELWNKADFRFGKLYADSFCKALETGLRKDMEDFDKVRAQIGL